MADKTKTCEKIQDACQDRQTKIRHPRSRQRRKTKAKVDPITLSVIRGILETTQREMTLSLEKTARSSVFNLAHDYSTALFNHVPEMILQGQDIPIHLGSLIPAMKSVARYFGDDIHEGDLILHNDPAFGGSHAIDVCMYKPVFYKGKLRYWTVLQGSSHRHRWPGTGRLQSERHRNLCRVLAHSAGRRSGTAASRAMT